jgi:hypothetical protein
MPERITPRSQVPRETLREEFIMKVRDACFEVLRAYGINTIFGFTEPPSLANHRRWRTSATPGGVARGPELPLPVVARP